jgi:hypothetical protein
MLTIIEDTNFDRIESTLNAKGIYSGIFTNGIYAAPRDVVLPTTLAGFQVAVDRFSRPHDALIVAINSDVSLDLIYEAKSNKLLADYVENGQTLETEDELNLAASHLYLAQDKLNAERGRTEFQNFRALKLAEGLEAQFENRNVVIMFYDEETPAELYEALALKGFGMTTLFKWGFGTKPDAPRIEGAINFENVLAFPFFDDAKAICHDITVAEDQSDLVKVMRLQEETHVRPAYISPDGKLLFRLAPDLRRYAPLPEEGKGFTALTLEA